MGSEDGTDQVTSSILGARPRSSSLGDEEALGGGLPANWTLEEFQKRVRGILDSYLLSGEVEEAVRSFQDFAVREASGFLDEVAVCALRTALEQTDQQRSRITELLRRLHEENILDQASLARGFAKLVCTWEDLVVDCGSKSSVYLVDMLLSCMRGNCVVRAFLMRLPEGLVMAVLREGSEDEDKTELQEVARKLQQFKRGIQAAKLLQPPLPTVDLAAKVIQQQAMPECHHEFVKRALQESVTWPPALRRRCVALIGQLLEKGVLSREDIQWGVIRLLGQLEDLTLDCPNVAEVAAEHLRALQSKDLLPTSFVKRCRMLRVGGAAGLGVLEAALQPVGDAASAAKSPKGKVQEALESEESREPEAEDSQPLEEVEAAPPSQELAGGGGSCSSAAPTPSVAGRLSGGASISLRPGGGISLRPGGGGSLTGGISLRPGGGASLRPPGEATSAGSSSKGYPPASSSSSAEVGKRAAQSASAKAVEDSDSWRTDAAKHQDSRKNRDRGGKGGSTSGSGRRQQGEGQSSGAGRGEAEPPPTPLAASENSWAAAQQQRRLQEEASAKAERTVAETPCEEEITRRMKAILNKLTLDKFDDLFRQLTTCGISTEEHIRILMTEVFEKATTQHHFVPMYTSLCVHLSEWFSQHVKVGNFKRILLDNCQASFEANLRNSSKELSSKKKKGASPEEVEEMEGRRQEQKKRVLGNIRLIGQLLVKRMVASKVLMACAQELLSEPSASLLEALASLLSTTGQEFDVPSWSHHADLCSVFSRVEELVKDKTIPVRTRFLLQDVLDLRASGWQDMKLATKKLEGPRRIGEFAEGNQDKD